ncbi:MAG: YggS family pyridoxal phosphate-dependent enzyme [Dysgonamonadaceae bacterium]|jgi:pyridoxal phosphate enzyme (YggS family)|nr:YggS family pyridoxal phosphate-dependent enzyme [Dysgonamonadaceae bacterium]
MNIASRLNRIKEDLPANVRLVAVSKFQEIPDIREAYRAGQRLFGESRVQELLAKYEHLPKDVEWHFIGHLQVNKVKYIVPLVAMLHSADSIKLLNELEHHAAKSGRRLKVLLQVHIAQEEAKFGFSFEEVEDFVNNKMPECYPHLIIAGLMGMATLTDDESQVCKEFSGLSALFTRLKEGYFSGNEDFKELSMGMSDDYPLAVEAGSTLVRIGTKIFGDRKQPFYGSDT